MLRKATKQALGVPLYSSTLRLIDEGAHNTVKKLIEAHLSNKRIRLSQTEQGRAVLRKIGWQIEPVPIKAALPDDWKTMIQTKPLPRNMTLDKDDERRTTRAKAMARKVSNSVLKAMQPWVIAQIKNTTQSDSPQVKRKPASRQAAEEGFSGLAPGPDRSSAP
ncbi:hypothetical protein MRX96_015482 [Rhipicephalus microplus]